MNLAKLENTIERFLRKLTSEKKSKHTILNYSSCLNNFLGYIRKNEYDIVFPLKDPVIKIFYDIQKDLGKTRIAAPKKEVWMKSFDKLETLRQAKKAGLRV